MRYYGSCQCRWLQEPSIGVLDQRSAAAHVADNPAVGTLAVDILAVEGEGTAVVVAEEGIVAAGSLLAEDSPADRILQMISCDAFHTLHARTWLLISLILIVLVRHICLFSDNSQLL